MFLQQNKLYHQEKHLDLPMKLQNQRSMVPEVAFKYEECFTKAFRDSSFKLGKYDFSISLSSVINILLKLVIIIRKTKLLFTDRYFWTIGT